MSSNRAIDVVVGGGVAGLVAALLLAERDGRRVIVIEREKEPGGLLRRFDYGKHGDFDWGMHNMYETGIAALDDLLFGLLPADQWQLLEGPKRDLAGLFFCNRLQHHSPFPDLRSLPDPQRDACLTGFFRQLDSGITHDPANAWADASTRLGQPIADLVIDVAIRKQFGRPAREMAVFSTRLTTLSRMVMFGEETFLDLMQASKLRELLAYPEQRTLPPQWASGRKAYYPKAYGMYRIIDALLARLRAAGVEILTTAAVQSAVREQGMIRRIQVSTPEGLRSIENIGKLLWTSGLPSLASLLGVDLRGYRFDPPRKTVVVNLLLKNPPDMGDLYYIYCYEPGCHTFRVTHFGAYCEGAPRRHGHPLAVELLLDEPLQDKPAILATAIRELQRFGVISGPGDINFSAVESLASGFPMPTVRNFEVLADIRNRLTAMDIPNLVPLGILSEKDVFFQRDVLAQVWNRLTLESPYG